MELTLGDVGRLTIQEAIYVLKESLKGYELLLRKAGKVEVSLKTVGLDRQGQCIVWLSEGLEILTIREN